MVYSYDENINLFWKLFNVGEIELYVKKGFTLAHHIISADYEVLIKHLVVLKRGSLNKYLTKPYIVNENLIRLSIPGEQTLLHISAQYNKSIYNKLKNIIVDTEDSIGKKAEDYYNNNNSKFIHEVNELVQKKYGINFDYDNIIIDQYENTQLKDKLIKSLENKKYLTPNSMHKKGKYINYKDNIIIQELIDELDTKYKLNLKNKTYKIYCFTAEYDDDKNNNLDIHKDSSIITINWNLSLSDDIEGTDLIFTNKDITVKPKENQLIIHHGKVSHRVTERQNGNRTNLIIWLS